MNSNPEPWQIAAASKTPIPASPAEERQDLLDKLREPVRITVETHERARREMLAGLLHERDFDDIDEAVADPIHDHRPQSAPKHKVNRVLSILDEIDRETTNRRFTR